MSSVILSEGGAHATGAPDTRGFRVVGWDDESKNPEDVLCAMLHQGVRTRVSR